MLILFLACAPDPCEAMCDAASTVYASCLDGWGASWADAGYEDELDFLGSCETWAWEMRQLEREQGSRGDTDRVCSDRAERLSADDATCADYTEIDWHQNSGKRRSDGP